MKENRNIQFEIDQTFDSINRIKKVDAPPFFKDKMMKRLFEQEEVEQKFAWSWFTPKLQLATLTCVIVLNFMAFTQLKSDTYNENVNSFATTYGLQSDSDNTLFN